ncbi:ABC transporter permease [Clostridiales bacterium COT073_COT-073]|nr:ABC transporter permease [Clostridiales bacterium COT073_COT-073]
MNAFLHAAIIAGIPLLLATLGETITEKAGHLNLGVEGMMLLGAVAGFATGLYTGSPVLAILAAILAGAGGALIYGILTISMRANQVVSGLALTIFGTGFSSYMGSGLIGQKLSEQMTDFFRPVAIPLLSGIPLIGDMLFRQDVFVYFSYLLCILIGIYLFKTNMGLNLQAIGENPSAADASGIPITRYKYIHVLLGGALCGLGGAYLSVVQVPQWQENITSGRGWIAIALVIFCKWNPWKSFFGAILFGGLSIVGFRLQQFNISQHILDMLPYLVTILVLAIGRENKKNSAPEAMSLPYFREER